MNADQPPAAGPSGSAERLSELVDGEMSAQGAQDLCRQWGADPALRQRWHAYHLIGDVLRSDDMATGAVRDTAFLDGLRQRLATEPAPVLPLAPLVPMQPARASAPAVPVRSNTRWLAPAAAVAAGFAVVAVALMVVRGDASPDSGGEVVAQGLPVPSSGLRRVDSAAQSASTPVLVLDGRIIRDARLDAYLEAHRGGLGVLPTATPGGPGRSVDPALLRTDGR